MSHPLQNYYSRIYRTYDLVNALFTFGMDKKWRKITVSHCLSSNPSKVLDLCCGTGDMAIAVAVNSRKGTRVTGYDLNPEMLEAAVKKALHKQVDVTFIRGDVADLPFSSNEFDGITIGFGFRNLTWQNPGRSRHISEISRVLRTGGKLLILESARPENPVIRFFYSLYLKAVLVPIGGLISGDWNAYRYLAGSSAGFYEFGELKTMLAEHGLELRIHSKFLFGSVNLLEAIKIAM